MTAKIGKHRSVGRCEGLQTLLLSTQGGVPPESLRSSREPLTTTSDQNYACINFGSPTTIEITREEPCKHGAFCFNINAGELAKVPERGRVYQQLAMIRIDGHIEFHVAPRQEPLRAVATERPALAAIFSIHGRAGQLLGYRVAIPPSALYLRDHPEHFLAPTAVGASIR